MDVETTLMVIFWAFVIFLVGGAILGGLLPESEDEKMERVVKTISKDIISSDSMGQAMPRLSQKGAFVAFDEAVVIDIETTGLDARRDRIISIGAVRVDFSKVTGGSIQLYCTTFETLVNPRREIPLKSFEKHGIYDHEVEKAEPFEEVAPELIEFIDALPLIAHNCAFEKAFINAELRRARFPIFPANQWYCTMERACAYMRYNGMPRQRISLDAALEQFNIFSTRSIFHKALEDAICTAKLAAQLYYLDNQHYGDAYLRAR